MKVYIAVTHCDYEADDIVRVFTSEEKAKAFVDEWDAYNALEPINPHKRHAPEYDAAMSLYRANGPEGWMAGYHIDLEVHEVVEG